MQLARARTAAASASAATRRMLPARLRRRAAASASSSSSTPAATAATATTPRRAPLAPPRLRRVATLAFSSTPSASTTTGSMTEEQQQNRRREALLRVVRDLYSTLYDFDDLSVTALVSPEVVLEDDALQVALQGPESVGDYLRWLHAGVDAGEPATATVDAAPLEKAVLAGAEAVLADEMAAAAKKAGFTIHNHEGGEREDCVIATWVAGEDGEVRGRDEFFFLSADAGGDPPIVRIHTSRVTAA